MELIPTGGKKIKNHHCEIATKLFIDLEEPIKDFTIADLPRLVNAVKNQINIYV